MINLTGDNYINDEVSQWKLSCCSICDENGSLALLKQSAVRYTRVGVKFAGRGVGP